MYGKNSRLNTSIFGILICILFILTIQACSLKAPGITFTQTQTASEKQMIGEDREIEENSWLISSIKSSSSGSEIWQRDVSLRNIKDRNHLILLKKLAYLQPELMEYRRKGYLGESYQGIVKPYPKATRFGTGAREDVPALAKKVNETRNRLLEIRKEMEPERDYREIQEEAAAEYLQTVEYGEYMEISPGNWIRKE